MKKTVFVGKVNDQEFDNVQAYNACVQAMLDMGKDFQATSSTQVVEVPDEDTCEGKCDCEQCTCAKEDTQKPQKPQKPLKPVTSMLPAYEDRDGGKYIDPFLSIEMEEAYNDAMDKLETFLNGVYDKVSEAIPHNSAKQLRVYNDAVQEMRNILNKDYEKTDTCLKPIKERIEALENELDELYDKVNKLETAEDVIMTYSEFYNAVNELLNPTEPKEPTTEPTNEVACGCEEPRANNAFINLLREFLNSVK